MYEMTERGKEDTLLYARCEMERLVALYKGAPNAMVVEEDDGSIRGMSGTYSWKAIPVRPQKMRHYWYKGHGGSCAKGDSVPSDALPEIGGIVPYAPSILLPLREKGRGYLILRHLWGAKLAHCTIDGKPALKLGSNAMRTGKALRRLFPRATHDKVIEYLARDIDGCNPIVGREKALSSFIVRGGVEWAEHTTDGLGSCMHGKGYWETLDEYLGRGEKCPDFSAAPGSNNEVYTVTWEDVKDKKLTNGAKELRAFVWAVEVEGEGLAWYMDRIYPANGALTNEWAASWATMVGIKHVNTSYYNSSGAGCYEDRAEQQPPMKHKLTTPLHPQDTDDLPWLDTFRYLSADHTTLLSPAASGSKDEGSDAHHTEGRWARECRCCGCGDEMPEDECQYHGDDCYCDYCFNGRFSICIHCDDSFDTDQSERTHHCCDSCAEGDGWVRCEECGQWEELEGCYISERGDAYCSEHCMSKHYVQCDECSDWTHEDDVIKACGKSFCSDSCREAEHGECSRCSEWNEDCDIDGEGICDACRQEEEDADI